MNDLQINIALAQALGWKEWGKSIPWGIMDNGYFHASFDGVVWCKYVEGNSFIEKRFDYRDPVIFVAICKHWRLTVCHPNTPNDSALVQGGGYYFFDNTSIEKAAAMCVIDLVKRGIEP